MFFPGSIVLYMLILFSQTGFQKEQIVPPNIVLIIADDVGWNDLGCYGNRTVLSPNIDSIARGGLLFKNAFLTASSCSPSRCSILSGRYPHNTGAAELHTPLPGHLPTIAGELRKRGYYTAQAGKWHMGNAAKEGFNKVYDNAKENGNSGAGQWIHVLRERPSGQPFFMWLASIDAHRPWGQNEFSGMHKPEDVEVPARLLDTPETRQDLADYYDEIYRWDHHVGVVMSELKRQGVLDNTLIVILSDNGRPFPGAKARLLDDGIRTPLIIKWNKGLSQKGTICSSLVSSIDIAPTLLELAGCAAPLSFQGRSFSNLLREPDRDFRSYIFAEHNWHDYEALERVVRDRDFAYFLNERPSLSNNGAIDVDQSPSALSLRKARESGSLNALQEGMFLQPQPVEELYDLLNDPEQTNNVANNPAFSERLNTLRGALGQWRTETGDTSPIAITPDWYDRETAKPLPSHGIRGEMPGRLTGADTINRPGPF